MDGLLRRLQKSREDDVVDVPLLCDLIVDTYQDFGKSEEVAERLLETITQYEVDDASIHPITVKRFADFLRHRGEYLRDVFARIDKNHDRKISLDDIYNYLDTSDADYDAEKIAAILHVLDTDNDGVVTVQEFQDKLLLVPLTRTNFNRFFYHAYNFFVEDLEITSDSDVLIESNSLGYFWCGGMAGVVSRTCTAPFDRLKVYLIAQGGPILSAIKTIYQSGGFRGFFVGNGLNVVKVFPESAMKFGSFETAKRAFAAFEGVDDPADISRLATFVSGGLGGMCAQLCVFPLDTTKFRVQSSNDNKPGRLWRTVRGVYREFGVRGFYRGLYVGVLGIFPFAALDLGIFSAFKNAYIKNQASRNNVDPADVQMGNLVVLSMGAISGSVGASAVYPINLVRTRIQMQGTPAHPFVYKGFLDCCRQTVTREGWHGFFRGLGPNLAKVAPSVSISYLVYENSKMFLGLH